MSLSHQKIIYCSETTYTDTLTDILIAKEHFSEALALIEKCPHCKEDVDLDKNGDDASGGGK
jgi:hypothetical protein